MNSRTIASLALGGVVLLSLAGCGAMTPIATENVYTAGDGLNVADRDGSSLKIRNAMIVADPDGQDGNLVAALVNSGAEDEVLTLDWETGSATYTVAAGEQITLGRDDVLLLSNIDTIPGSIANLYVQSGSGDGVEALVPVLNDCLAEYEGLAPNSDTSDRSYCEKYTDPSVLEAEH